MVRGRTKLMYCKNIRREFPDFEIHEAKDISEMYSKISVFCDFLFQDIALTGSVVGPS